MVELLEKQSLNALELNKKIEAEFQKVKETQKASDEKLNKINTEFSSIISAFKSDFSKLTDSMKGEFEKTKSLGENKLGEFSKQVLR